MENNRTRIKNRIHKLIDNCSDEDFGIPIQKLTAGSWKNLDKKMDFCDCCEKRGFDCAYEDISWFESDEQAERYCNECFHAYMELDKKEVFNTTETFRKTVRRKEIVIMWSEPVPLKQALKNDYLSQKGIYYIWGSPKDKKKTVKAAGLVFLGTYIPLMTKVYRIYKDITSETEGSETE